MFGSFKLYSLGIGCGYENESGLWVSRMEGGSAIYTLFIAIDGPNGGGWATKTPKFVKSSNFMIVLKLMLKLIFYFIYNL